MNKLRSVDGGAAGCRSVDARSSAPLFALTFFALVVLILPLSSLADKVCRKRATHALTAHLATGELPAHRHLPLTQAG